MRHNLVNNRDELLAIWSGYMEGMHGFGVSSGNIALVARFCNVAKYQRALAFPN